jgi:sugar phosphate isomerase/epimerase
MRTIKGPGLFLAQFIGDAAPFNSLAGLARWSAGMGYKGIQIPTLDKRIFDLDRAADSTSYCDGVRGLCADHGLAITELSTHLQGQLVAVHPAYDEMMDGFAPSALRGKPTARQQWAVDQVTKAAEVSRRLGLTETVTFTGSLAWPYLYPYPQRPAGMIDIAFAELGRRWRPILDAYDAAGVDVGFEIHPTEDVFDGITFEMFLDAVGHHRRCRINYDASHFIKQGMDYVGFIDVYHERICSFHVKDAEFNPTARQGMLSGYQPWLKRAARDRSLGDGQVDFRRIFAKLTEYDFAGWAVYEWEDCIKDPDEAAREGAPFIARHIITATTKTFDDFAGTRTDDAASRRMLGVS